MPNAEYIVHGQVRNEATSLTRHDRVDLADRFHLCSWREMRQPKDPEKKRTNRKFYGEQREWWSLPADKALLLLTAASDAGLLQDNQDDPSLIVRYKVIAPGDAEYQTRMREVIVAPFNGEDRDELWQNSVAVICYQKCGHWLKVMLIDRDQKRVTFRSLTDDPKYGMALKKWRSADGWFLDNAMLDAHMSAFRIWLNYLKAE